VSPVLSVTVFLDASTPSGISSVSASVEVGSGASTVACGSGKVTITTAAIRASRAITAIMVVLFSVDMERYQFTIPTTDLLCVRQSQVASLKEAS